MKRTTISKALALPIVLAATLAAQPAAQAAPWLNVDGQINFDANSKNSNDYETSHLRVQDAELRFELIIREGIKAVVKAELESKLNSSTMDNDFDMDKFIEEAYIQIETDKISGLPRAIITVGKHEIAFGQHATELPMFKDGLLYDLTKQNEVIGMTVELPTNFFKIVDSVAVSVFEAGAGDLKIADEKGMSLKLTKKLSDQLQAQVSYMMKEHAGTTDKEQRGSIGFVFSSKDGNWKVWAEGVVVTKNPLYADDTKGGSIGGSYKVGPGTVVVEYSYLQDQAQEIAAAYNMPVGSNLVLSPEVRHRKDLSGTGSDDTVIGIRARLQFQKDNAHNLLTGRRG